MTAPQTPLLWNHPASETDQTPLFALAHGAGAAMDTPWMEALATGLAAAGVAVVRFEFPYMQKRRAEGSRRPPDRAPALLDTWRNVISSLRGPRPLLIGGKSMGGRMASMVADEHHEDDSAAVAGLVCLGYPFHPPRKPESTRTAHLATLETPTLILQGTRDPFGRPDEVATYDLSPAIQIHWLDDGDHSFKPRKASGHTQDEHLASATAAIVRFARTLTA